MYSILHETSCSNVLFLCVFVVFCVFVGDFWCLNEDILMKNDYSFTEIESKEGKESEEHFVLLKFPLKMKKTPSKTTKKVEKSKKRILFKGLQAEPRANFQTNTK
jgi:hypothetical protein